MTILRVMFSIVLLISAGVIASCSASAAPTATPLGLGDVPSGAVINGQLLDAGQRIGDLSVWVSTDLTPPTIGRTVLDALVVDDQGQPVNDAKVSFDIDMTNMSHGVNVTAATNVGGGHYTGEVRLVMMGPWRVIVVVERPNREPVRARFNFEVH